MIHCKTFVLSPHLPDKVKLCVCRFPWWPVNTISTAFLCLKSPSEALAARGTLNVSRKWWLYNIIYVALVPIVCSSSLLPHERTTVSVWCMNMNFFTHDPCPWATSCSIWWHLEQGHLSIYAEIKPRCQYCSYFIQGFLLVALKLLYVWCHFRFRPSDLGRNVAWLSWFNI